MPSKLLHEAGLALEPLCLQFVTFYTGWNSRCLLRWASRGRGKQTAVMGLRRLLMITEESKPEASKHTQNAEAAAEPGIDSKFKTLLIILALLVLAEAYSLARISSMRKALAAQDAQTRKEL